MAVASDPKVLFVANAFPPIVGGSANVYASLCQNLAPDACAIAPKRTYYDGREVPGWRDWDGKQPFAVHRLDLLRPEERPKPRTPLHSAWRWWSEDRRIEREIEALATAVIRREKVNVICAGEIYSLSGVAQAIGRKTQTPVIFYIHGEELTCVPSGRRYQRNAVTALRSAAGLVAVSSFTREQLIANYDVDPSRVHVIPNGVDVQRFSPGEKRRNVIERHGLSGKRVLLTVGRLVTRKGHDTVIQALPKIREAAPDIVYLVVGDGPERSRLQELVREVGVQDAVIFATGVSGDELVDYYRLCDVFIMPNRTLPDGDTEGFGLVFLEAGACGKPVIAGRAGGVPDAVGHEDNGLLIDGASEDDVAAAAIRLLGNRELATKLGQNGIARAAQASWEGKAAEFKSVCRLVTEQAAGRSVPNRDTKDEASVYVSR